MQRFVLLASVAAAQCDRTVTTAASVKDPAECQAHIGGTATALVADQIPTGSVCVPTCADTEKNVPKAAKFTDYACSGSTAVADWDCVEGCPAQGPATAADLTLSATQGYCASAADSSNWVAKDASCTNQCDTGKVAWPKTTKCAAGGKLAKYRCVTSTDCIIVNNSAAAEAKAAKNCDDDASETYDSENGGSIVAKDKKCKYQCPDKYKVKGDKLELTCGTDTDFGTDQSRVTVFECEKEDDDSDTGSASSVSLAVSVLAVMKAAFA